MTDSVITAVKASIEATEGNSVQSTFSLSSALASATTVKVSLQDPGADSEKFEYRMGITGGWTSVPDSGEITINAGVKVFQLQAKIIYDGLTEYAGEMITFIVEQTGHDNGLSNSWYVDSVIKLADPASAGSTANSITPVSIKATTVTANKTALEGKDAVSTFKLSGALEAETVISASVAGYGATAEDYGTLLARTKSGTTWSGWASVNDDKVTLKKNTTDFELKVAVILDGVKEYSESVAFVVAQDATSQALKDSWYVADVISLIDVTVVGSPTGMDSST